ncbi:hypothetical protein IM697_22820 [Streptomyces ferrugineus]|uniref:Uncharacterized protein n=1 Tax=Streptomyces ferrugineus TaxID=1413221 RepID=A0A7M2SBI4_9ACTN|nr:hypothetical protein [Streptomyces ferrugineus]QOV33105.1 hypothetical protein IM697_22820 [Streptomyces ferrugineus]
MITVCPPRAETHLLLAEAKVASTRIEEVQHSSLFLVPVFDLLVVDKIASHEVV